MRLFILAVLLIVLAGCTQPGPVADNTTSGDVNDSGAHVVGGDADEHGCIGSAGYSWCEGKQKCLRQWEEPCEGKLNLTEAREIAEKSDCMMEGSLTSEKMYNNNSHTWWLGLNLTIP